MFKILLTSVAICTALLLNAQPTEFSARKSAVDGDNALLMIGNLTFDMNQGLSGDFIAAVDPTFAVAGFNPVVFAMGDPTTALIGTTIYDDLPGTMADEGITCTPAPCEQFFMIAYRAADDAYYIYPDGDVAGGTSNAAVFDKVADATFPNRVDAFSDLSQVWNFATTNEFIFPALPIVLLSFEAKDQGETVLLDWVTATETNNDYFTLERSPDGESYRTIGRMAGAGTTTTPQPYQFVDEDPLYGTSYYRIKQTDYDGAYTYTPVRSIERKRSQVNLTPNPTNGEVFVVLPDLNKEENVTLTIFNQLGQPVRTLDWTNMAGSQSLDLSDLSQGTYHLQFQSRTLQAGQLLVKL